MKKFNSVNLIILSIFLFSCAKQISSSDSTSRIIKKSKIKSEIVLDTVTWEPNPRSIAKGNDGQLLVRASESMNLLFAASGKNGKQDLFLSRSRDIGDSFSKNIRVNSEIGEVSAHGENGPKLRQGKGRGIFAAWIGNRDIKFARSMNFGRSFSPSIKVNDDLGKASQSFFTMEVAPDGTILLVWLDGRDKKNNSPGTSSLYIARSTDNGLSFEKNKKIAGNICPCCRPSLSFGPYGEVFVSWRHVYKNNERKIVVASSLNSGIDWSLPKPVTKRGWKINGCPHSGPVLSYIDGSLFVAWYSATGRKPRIKLSRSIDKGISFETLQDIHANILDANHPNMIRIGNEIWVIFQGRDPAQNGGWGNSKAWLVRIKKDGTIGRPTDLPSQGGAVSYPKLYSGTGGRVYALWTEYRDSLQNTVLCRGRIGFNS